jgi:mannose-6-phosphate isomerase-like protein (cupin superfamily)
MKTLLSLAIALCGASSCFAQDTATKPTSEVVAASEIEWQQLNPKRGDASPKAANIWGDRNGVEATGFLVKFMEGFSSPPHIHNVTYRGVVISGHVHNDDPDATEMWMPAGSFWTQPAGEVHITSARGRETVAYIEIEKGPYLVLPTDQAFDRGERPVNVDASNIVWLDGSNTTWVDHPANTKAEDGPHIAHLWGKPQDNQLNGSLVKLPAGFAGQITGSGSSFRAVVVGGQPNHRLADTAAKAMKPGSYFGSNSKVAHHVETSEGCTIYIRSNGKFNVAADKPKK